MSRRQPSKYQPHQGDAEKVRRIWQLRHGRLRTTQLGGRRADVRGLITEAAIFKSHGFYGPKE